METFGIKYYRNVQYQMEENHSEFFGMILNSVTTFPYDTYKEAEAEVEAVIDSIIENGE